MILTILAIGGIGGLIAAATPRSETVKLSRELRDGTEDYHLRFTPEEMDSLLQDKEVEAAFGRAAQRQQLYEAAARRLGEKGGQ